MRPELQSSAIEVFQCKEPAIAGHGANPCQSLIQDANRQGKAVFAGYSGLRLGMKWLRAPESIEMVR
jgi:hypothetical protein